MGKVFISYSSKNKKVALAICSMLEQHGVACWMAPRDIPSASSYAGEITRAVKAAESVLLVFSKDSCKSEHVKNEITLAINNAKPILPYCLDNSPYDDDLEYYLASKQRISSGDFSEDCQVLLQALQPQRTDHNTESVSVQQNEEKVSNWKAFLIPIAVLLIAAICLYLIFKDPPDDPILSNNSEQPAQTTAEDNINAQTVDTSVIIIPPTTKTDNNSDTFTGKIINGYPNGYGIYTFKQRRRIDMHDDKARYAEAGDYIEGDWTNGHLNYGEWYSADGVKKDFIELGDSPDVQLDHNFKKCVKP